LSEPLATANRFDDLKAKGSIRDQGISDEEHAFIEEDLRTQLNKTATTKSRNDNLQTMPTAPTHNEADDPMEGSKPLNRRDA
jgi:hypothetical protein